MLYTQHTSLILSTRKQLILKCRVWIKYLNKYRLNSLIEIEGERALFSTSMESQASRKSLKGAAHQEKLKPCSKNSEITDNGKQGTEFQLHNFVSNTLNLKPTPSSDPNEPLNWPKYRKYYTMFLASMCMLFCFSLQCIAVPSWTVMVKELDWSFDELNNSYAISLATIAIGCVFLIPLGLDYGRRSLYIFSMTLMIAGTAWSAKMYNVWELYVTQIILGLGTSTSEILIELVISDLFFVHERATMNGVALVACYLGNNMSQVAGGYITMSQGWRWNYWYCLIFISTLWLLMVCTFEETKFTTVLPRRASYDGEKTCGKNLWIDETIPMKPLKERLSLCTKTNHEIKIPLRKKWVRPFIILATLPVVLFVSIQYGLTIAWTSIMSTASTQYFATAPYNWSPAAIGNINISAFVGTVIGTIVGGYMCDLSVVKLSKWNNGVFEPEMRLWSVILPTLAIIASLFMFGYGFEKSLHWSVPTIAFGLCSFGGTAVSDSILTYLLDCYRDIFGQSLTGVVFVQYIPPTALIFASQPWIRAVGIDKVFLICGCISILAFLTLFPMILFGRRVRHYGKLNRNFQSNIPSFQELTLEPS